MPSTRMNLKRHAPESPNAPVASHVPEQHPPVAPAPPSPTSEASSDDDAISPSEGNPDAFSDDCVSSDGDASSSRPRRATADTRAISVVSEALKRDHRWLHTPQLVNGKSRFTALQATTSLGIPQSASLP
jgi:hypothetical protein